MNRVTRKFFIAWLWAMAAAAALVLIISPAPMTNTSVQNGAEPVWSISRLPTKIDLAPAVAALAKGNLWGGQLASSSETDGKALQWRMAAIVGAGRDRVVIVQFGDERSLPLKVGDKFPDGTPVAEIRDNGVCVLLDGRKRFLPMPGQSAAIIW